MANITALPRRGSGETTLGFDTGPGNVLLDAWAARNLGAPRDAGGSWAAQALIDPALLGRLRSDPYFARPAPKSTGREDFDLPWLEAQLAGHAVAPAAVQATLVELTATTIADGIRTLPGDAVTEVLVCGGGRRNELLMERIAANLPDAAVTTTDSVGIDGDWVEAIAFAWLAQRTLGGRAGNAPEATGAAGPRILGAVHAGSPP